MLNDFIAPVCSNKPKPSVARGKGFYKTGAAIWGRDTYHAAKSGMTTFCGRDASEWLRMDRKPTAEALADNDFCKRCAAKLETSK